MEPREEEVVPVVKIVAEAEKHTESQSKRKRIMPCVPNHPDLGPMPIAWFIEMKVINPIVAILLFICAIVFFASVPTKFASWILVSLSRCFM